MKINPLFDLSEFTRQSAPNQLSIDDSFEAAFKCLQDSLRPFIEILDHPKLSPFHDEVALAKLAVSKIRAELIDQIRPVYTAFQSLQDSLDYAACQRLLPGFTEDPRNCLNRISRLAPTHKEDATLKTAQGSGQPIQVTESTHGELQARSRPTRRRERLNSRPLHPGEPYTPGYKSTDIGFQAILEYSSEDTLSECEDSEL